MKKQLLAACLLSTLALPTFAKGFYVAGEVGRSKIDFNERWFVFKDNSTLLGIAGGYQFTDTIALELNYRDLGSFRDGGGYSNSYSIETDAKAIQLSVLASWPVNPSIDIYGRLGMARLKAETTFRYKIISYDISESESDTKNKAVFGIGSRIAINEKTNIRLEYSQYAKWDDVTFSALSIGASYHF